MATTITLDNETVLKNALKKFSKEQLKKIIYSFLEREIQKKNIDNSNLNGYYDDDGVPLTWDGKVELTPVNYNELTKEEKKSIDAFDRGELKFINL